MMNRQVKLFWLLISLLLVTSLTACSLLSSLGIDLGTKKEDAAENPAEVNLGVGFKEVRQADGMVMMYIPSGEFTMGSSEAMVEKMVGQNWCPSCKKGSFGQEMPAHKVTLNAYWIDQFEVTNAQYSLCVAAGACNPPTNTSGYSGAAYYGEPAFASYPVTGVTWQDAESYCQWADARLLTEAEWEKAARGMDERLFPWGDMVVSANGNFCDQSCPMDDRVNLFNDGFPETAPVGSFPASTSPYGALDMSGNVWEWVADWYDKGYYGNSPADNPTGPPMGTERVIRGGSWIDMIGAMRVSNRSFINPGSYYYNIGIRCGASSMP